MDFFGIFPNQILPMLMNFQLELKNDNKHRFFLIFRKVLRNGYFLKYFALELITPILMYVLIMDKKQSKGFNQHCYNYSTNYVEPCRK